MIWESLYIGMKIAIVLWELAHMELHLSEHLTAPGSPTAPLACMSPHFGWSTCTKAAEVISVVRVNASIDDSAVTGKKFVLCTHSWLADHIYHIHANKTTSHRATSHRENGHVLTDLQECTETVFIKFCIISTWMGQTGLLGKVPDIWPCTASLGGHGNIPFLLRKAFSNRKVQWLEWAGKEVLGSVWGRGAAGREQQPMGAALLAHFLLSVNF